MSIAEVIMSDNNIECYGELVSEVLTAISQVYWGRMYKYIKDNNILISQHLIGVFRRRGPAIPVT